MIEFPSWLEWLGAAIGMEWPHGNEDDMWALAGDWHTAADELREILNSMDDAKSATLAAYPAGDGRQQMSDTFDGMRSGKDSLEALAGYFDQIGDSVDGGGTQIQYTKLMFYSTLVITAADIAAVWIFPPTAPAEEAGIIIATRVAVRMMFRRMLTTMAGWAGRLAENALVRFLFRHVLLNAALGALQEFAVQEFQVWQGHRKGLDWNQLGVTTFAAGVGGAAGGGVGEALGRKFGNAFRNEAGDITSKWGVNLTRAGIGAGSGLVNSAAAFGGSIGWQFASDVAHGNLDTALDNLKNTHVDWRMFSAGAITGGGSALNHNFAHSHFENSPFWKLNSPRVDLGNIGDLHNFQHDGTVPNVHADVSNGNGFGPHGNTQTVHGEPGSSGPVHSDPVSNGHDGHTGAPTTTAGTHEPPASGAGPAPEHTASPDHSDSSAPSAQTSSHDRPGPVDSSAPPESKTAGPAATDSPSAPVSNHQGVTGHDSTPSVTSDAPVSHPESHESATPAASSGPESVQHAPADTASSAPGASAASAPSASSGPVASSGPSSSAGSPAAPASGVSPIDARGAAPTGGSDAPRTGDVRGTDGRAPADLNRGAGADTRTPGRAGSADTPGARPAADSRVQARTGDSESPRAANRAGASEGERVVAKPGRGDTGSAQDRAGAGARTDRRPETPREAGESGRSADERTNRVDADGEGPSAPERDVTSARDHDESAPRDEQVSRDEPGVRDSDEPASADRDAADTERPARSDDPSEHEARPGREDEQGPHDDAEPRPHPDDELADRGQSRPESDGAQDKSGTDDETPRRRPAAHGNDDGSVAKPHDPEAGETTTQHKRDEPVHIRPEDQAVPGMPAHPADAEHAQARPGRGEQSTPDHQGAPEPVKPAARDDSKRGRCAELALWLIKDLTGSKTVRVPERAVGPEGMTAAEVQADAGGRLVKVADHDAIARRLARMRKGAMALVVDGYHAGPGRRVVGAHAYVMIHEGGGRIVVRDESTGVVTDHPADVPAELHDTQMILFDHKGRPVHLLSSEQREALARQRDPVAVRIRQALDDHTGRVHELLLRRAEVVVDLGGEQVRLRMVADEHGNWRVESAEPVWPGPRAPGTDVEPAAPGRRRSLWQRFTGGYEGHNPKYPSGSGQDGKYQTEMTEDFGHLFDIHALETLGDHDISINYARLLKESVTLWINREHAPLLERLTARMELQAGEHIPMHNREGREYAYWNEDADPAEVAAMHKYLRDVGLGHLVDESQPHDLPVGAPHGESEAPQDNPADELRAAAGRLGIELTDLSPETVRRALDTAEYQNLRRAAVIEALRDAAHRFNAEHADIPYRPQSISDHNPIGRFLKEMIIAQGDDPGMLNWRGVNNGAESGRDFDVLNVENPDERIEYDPEDESGRDQGLRSYFENALRRDQIRDERATWADLLAAELSRLEPDGLDAALNELRDGVHERAGEIRDLADQVDEFRKYFPTNDIRELPPERPGEPGRLVILDVHGDHEQVLAGAMDRHPGLAARLNNGEVRAEKWTVVVDTNNVAHVRHLGDIDAHAISVDVRGRHLDGLLVRDGDGNWHVAQPPAEPGPMAPDARTPGEIRAVRDDLARELGLDPEQITPELIERELRANDLRALQVEALLDHARSSDAIETFHDLANARDRLAQTTGVDDPARATPEQVGERIADGGTRNALRKQQVEMLVKYYDKLSGYLQGRGEDRAGLVEARDNLVRALGGEPEDVHPSKYSKELAYTPDPLGIDPGALASLIHDRAGEPGTREAITDFVRALGDTDPFTNGLRFDPATDPRVFEGEVPMHDPEARNQLREVVGDGRRLFDAPDPDEQVSPGSRPNRDWARLLGHDLTDATPEQYVRAYEAYRDGKIEKHERLDAAQRAEVHAQLREEVRGRAADLRALLELNERFHQAVADLPENRRARIDQLSRDWASAWIERERAREFIVEHAHELRVAPEDLLADDLKDGSALDDLFDDLGARTIRGDNRADFKRRFEEFAAQHEALLDAARRFHDNDVRIADLDAELRAAVERDVELSRDEGNEGDDGEGTAAAPPQGPPKKPPRGPGGAAEAPKPDDGRANAAEPPKLEGGRGDSAGDGSAVPPRAETPAEWGLRMRAENASWSARMAERHAIRMRELAGELAARDPDGPDGAMAWDARMRADQAEWEARFAAQRADWLWDLVGNDRRPAEPAPAEPVADEPKRESFAQPDPIDAAQARQDAAHDQLRRIARDLGLPDRDNARELEAAITRRLEEESAEQQAIIARDDLRPDEWAAGRDRAQQRLNELYGIRREMMRAARDYQGARMAERQLRAANPQASQGTGEQRAAGSKRTAVEPVERSGAEGPADRSEGDGSGEEPGADSDGKDDGSGGAPVKPGGGGDRPGDSGAGAGAEPVAAADGGGGGKQPPSGGDGSDGRPRARESWHQDGPQQEHRPVTRALRKALRDLVDAGADRVRAWSRLTARAHELGLRPDQIRREMLREAIARAAEAPDAAPVARAELRDLLSDLDNGRTRMELDRRAARLGVPLPSDHQIADAIRDRLAPPAQRRAELSIELGDRRTVDLPRLERLAREFGVDAEGLTRPELQRAVRDAVNNHRETIPERQRRSTVRLVDRYRVAAANESARRAAAQHAAERELMQSRAGFDDRGPRISGVSYRRIRLDAPGRLRAEGAVGERGRWVGVGGHGNPEIRMPARERVRHATEGFDAVYFGVELDHNGRVWVSEHHPDIAEAPAARPDPARRPGDWVGGAEREHEPSTRGLRRQLRDLGEELGRRNEQVDKNFTKIVRLAEHLGIDNAWQTRPRELAGAVRDLIAARRARADELWNRADIPRADLKRFFEDRRAEEARAEEAEALGKALLGLLRVHDQTLVAARDRVAADAALLAARDVAAGREGHPLGADGRPADPSDPKSAVARLVPGRGGAPDRLVVVTPGANPDRVIDPAVRRALLGADGEFVFHQVHVDVDGRVRVIDMHEPPPELDRAAHRPPEIEATRATADPARPAPDADPQTALDAKVRERAHVAADLEFWRTKVDHRAEPFGDPDLSRGHWSETLRQLRGDNARYVRDSAGPDAPDLTRREQLLPDQEREQTELVDKLAAALDRFFHFEDRLDAINREIHELERQGARHDASLAEQVRDELGRVADEHRAAVQRAKPLRRIRDELSRLLDDPAQRTPENLRRLADADADADADAEDAVRRAEHEIDRFNDERVALTGAWPDAVADHWHAVNGADEPPALRRLSENVWVDRGRAPEADGTGARPARIIVVAGRAGFDHPDVPVRAGDPDGPRRPGDNRFDAPLLDALALHHELTELLKDPATVIDRLTVTGELVGGDRDGAGQIRPHLDTLAPVEIHRTELPAHGRMGGDRLPFTGDTMVRWRGADGRWHDPREGRARGLRAYQPDLPPGTKLDKHWQKEVDGWRLPPKGWGAFGGSDNSHIPYRQREEKMPDGFSGTMGAEPFQNMVEPLVIKMLTDHWPDLSYEEILTLSEAGRSELWWHQGPGPKPEPPAGWDEEAHHGMPLDGALYTIGKRWVQLYDMARKHPWVLGPLQRRPEIGEWVREHTNRLPDGPFDPDHPVLRKIPIVRSFRGWKGWRAGPRIDLQPPHRPWSAAEHVPPRDRVEWSTPRQDRDIARWDAVQRWADRMIGEFARDTGNSDVHRIVDVLTQPRDPLLDPGEPGGARQEALNLARHPDGTPLTREELAERIQLVKDHLMRNEMWVRDHTDPTGRLVKKTYDPLAHVADAWLRLTGIGDGDGRTTPHSEDLLLLDDAYVEAKYLADHDDATWHDADLEAARHGYDWDTNRRRLSGHLVIRDGLPMHPGELPLDAPEHDGDKTLRMSRIPYAADSPAPDPAWLSPRERWPAEILDATGVRQRFPGLPRDPVAALKHLALRGEGLRRALPAPGARDPLLDLLMRAGRVEQLADAADPGDRQFWADRLGEPDAAVEPRRLPETVRHLRGDLNQRLDRLGEAGPPELRGGANTTRPALDGAGSQRGADDAGAGEPGEAGPARAGQPRRADGTSEGEPGEPKQGEGAVGESRSGQRAGGRRGDGTNGDGSDSESGDRGGAGSVRRVGQQPPDGSDPDRGDAADPAARRPRKTYITPVPHVPHDAEFDWPDYKPERIDINLPPPPIPAPPPHDPPPHEPGPHKPPPHEPRPHEPGPRKPEQRQPGADHDHHGHGHHGPGHGSGGHQHHGAGPGHHGAGHSGDQHDHGGRGPHDHAPHDDDHRPPHGDWPGGGHGGPHGPHRHDVSGQPGAPAGGSVLPNFGVPPWLSDQGTGNGAAPRPFPLPGAGIGPNANPFENVPNPFGGAIPQHHEPPMSQRVPEQPPADRNRPPDRNQVPVPPNNGSGDVPRHGNGDGPGIGGGHGYGNRPGHSGNGHRDGIGYGNDNGFGGDQQTPVDRPFSLGEPVDRAADPVVPHYDSPTQPRNGFAQNGFAPVVPPMPNGGHPSGGAPAPRRPASPNATVPPPRILVQEFGGFRCAEVDPLTGSLHDTAEPLTPFSGVYSDLDGVETVFFRADGRLFVRVAGQLIDADDMAIIVHWQHAGRRNTDFTVTRAGLAVCSVRYRRRKPELDLGLWVRDVLDNPAHRMQIFAQAPGAP